MNKIRSAVAVLLAVVLATFCFTSCADDTTQTPVSNAQEDTFIQPVFTETPASVKKTEVVYVTMDGNGTFQSATVRDRKSVV